MQGENAQPDQVEIKLQLHLPILTLALLMLAAFFLPDRIWNTLLLGFGGMLVVAYFWVRQLAHSLHGERSTRSQWVSVGDILEETFQIWNNNPVPALWVEVIDESNVPNYQAAVVRSPGSNQADIWHETAVCLQRGQYHLGPWKIRSGDPFGIFSLTIHYAQTREIIIHPPIHTDLPFRLPAGQSSGRVRARQRSLQATTNAATIRAYTHGDPLRWIHWPSTARRDDLFVRQFDLDASGDIWLLLDMQQSVQCGQGIDSSEEYAVLLAAAITARAIGQNRAIGLACYGKRPQIIPTGTGGGQQWRILRTLALIQADGTSPLPATLIDLGKVAKQGSAAVIITANPESSWIPELLQLAQRGIESNVFLFDQPSFGEEGNSKIQQSAIHNLGINCQVIYQGDINTRLPKPEEKQKIKITPFGKAVIVADGR